MPDIITRNLSPVEKNWSEELANAISDPHLLLQRLEITTDTFELGFKARQLFAQRVPISFVERMEKGNPNDPLLRQVLPLIDEFQLRAEFSLDPLGEQNNEIPGLLHKYKNRVLMILKAGCAINCRYCFRRHFPYQENKGNKATWTQALNYIAMHDDIDEIILSGGDPLMAKDHELDWLFDQIDKIQHIKTVRIHSRLPIVIPNRITDDFVQLCAKSRFNMVLVTHVNHANEIDQAVKNAMMKLRNHQVTLLNQSVLLAGVNDSVADLKALSHALFSAGILPYYLHVLDKVEGAAHFLVEDAKAKRLMSELIQEISGYLVPRLMREEAGKASKTPLDLYLES